jgi:hypothetical protein
MNVTKLSYLYFEAKTIVEKRRDSNEKSLNSMLLHIVGRHLKTVSIQEAQTSPLTA